MQMRYAKSKKVLVMAAQAYSYYTAHSIYSHINKQGLHIISRTSSYCRRRDWTIIAKSFFYDEWDYGVCYMHLFPNQKHQSQNCQQSMSVLLQNHIYSIEGRISISLDVAYIGFRVYICV